MKILWLTPIFPYPPYSGGQTRSYNLIKNLARTNQISLFSFWRPDRIQGPPKAMAKYCPKIKIFPGRKLWSIRNLALAGFSRLPLTITHFYGDSQVKQAIANELQNQKYDLIHFESFYTSAYLDTPGVSESHTPGVLGNENIEYLIYQRLAQTKKFLPLKFMLGYDVWKMKRYEQAAWQKTNLNIAVSQTDSQIITKTTGKKCPIIPNGVDFNYFQKVKKIASPIRETIRFLFVGDFKYFTNQDAIKFMLAKIWPQLKNKLPQAKLRLVGRHPTGWLKQLNLKDVIVDTQVEDIRQAYAEADIFLAPMRIASGTNIKILEAMAAGLPVITTKVGGEGISARHDHELIISNQPSELVNQVTKIIEQPDKSQQLVQAAKKLVKNHYDWPQITKKLNNVYKQFVPAKSLLRGVSSEASAKRDSSDGGTKRQK